MAGKKRYAYHNRNVVLPLPFVNVLTLSVDCYRTGTVHCRIAVIIYQHSLMLTRVDVSDN